jgi:hypothetical protein
MGNSAPKIAVRVSQDSVVAGNVLTGRIYLSAHGCDFSVRRIKMKFTGFEQSIIVLKENKNGKIQERKECVKCSIIDYDVVIKTFPSSGLSGGQYEIPFEWQIPDWLPSTMTYCHSIDKSRCSIEYHLKVYLDRFDYSDDKSEVFSTIPITIFGASSFKQSKIIMDCERYHLRACCCSNRGVITMGWDANCTVARPGDRVTVGIIGKNESIVEVQHFLVEVVETITWTANGHKRNNMQKIASQKYDIDGNTLWIPITKLPTKHEMRNSRYETIPLDNNPDILAGKKVGTIILNNDARDSYDGKLIEIRHSLVISATTPCCITAPQSSALIRVQKYAYDATDPNPIPLPTAPILEDDTIFPPFQIEPKDSVQPPLVLAEIIPTNWNPLESELVVVPSKLMIPNESDVERFIAPQDEGQPYAYVLSSHSSLVEVQTIFSGTLNLSDALDLCMSRPDLTIAVQNLSPT